MTTLSARPAVAGRARSRDTPTWWRDAAGLAFWASLVVVTALWELGGGLQDLVGGTGSAVSSLGRLTGLVSSDLLLVQVLLLARVPWLERSYGQDALARLHRLVGFTSFTLLVTHVVLVTVGYAVLADVAVLGQAVDLVVGYPGMLLATAGALLLVAVTATSIRRARRRLRYESWHLLHLYAYLGVGLALPHQLWTGTDFRPSPVATAYWWAAWAATAAAVLVYRVGIPVFRTLRHRLVVERVVPEAPGVLSVVVRGRHLDALRVRAGQFFVWRFLDGRPGWSRGHPWSLSAPASRDRLRITVRDVGDGSGRLAQLAPGTRVAIEGPFGRLTGESRTRRGLVFVGAGVGAAPLVALAEELAYHPGEAVFVHRVHSEEQALLGRDLDDLATRRGLRVVRVPGGRARTRPSWLPEAWSLTPDAEALRRLAPSLTSADVYVCGPQDWATCVLQAARTLGVPEQQLHAERFSW